VIKTKVKPFSVNKAWQGKRYRTREYKAWREQMQWILPNDYKVPEGKKLLIVTFGVSSKLADWDNPVKPFQDALQDKYSFDDKEIYQSCAAKQDVPKGSEYIKWELRAAPDYVAFMEAIKDI